MTERIVGRPWTDEEDKLLTDAVARLGEHDNWKIVALSVPGRTNKACRKRWLHSLSPTIKKSAWTSDEDKQLIEQYALHGSKWSTIARKIPGRTDDACSKRYREALDPNLKKDDWTPDEDAKLAQVYHRIGGKWGQVGQELQRSGLGCRNRWRLLERKRASKLAQAVRIDQIPDFQPTHHETISNEQVESIQPHWPPYYPPEAYPSYPTDENTRPSHGFREPTPEDISPLPPHVAPFQFSSSSLSAALSDPPPISRPLPIDIYDIHVDPALQVSSASSPPSFDSNLNDSNDNLMSPNSSSILTNGQSFFSNESPGTGSSIHFYDSHGILIRERHLDDSFSTTLIPNRGSPLMISNHDGDSWTSPHVSSSFSVLSFEQPISSPFNSMNGIHDDLSSTTSTPFGFSSLSPVRSPSTASSVELPENEQSSSGSLLFSSHLRSEPSRKRPRQYPKDPRIHPVQTRLSSVLPLTTDPSVRPYACGREQCWPTNATTSCARFSTSKELFDHSKAEHANDPPGVRPFRCALEGCGKSWKSLNGLQYHLQLSTAHFRTALSSTFSAQRQSSTEEPASTSPADISDQTNRTYYCHYPQCYKAYRQPSGLRYHYKHGHPAQMPIQLSVVPPALARQIPSKTKKMRRKSSSETDQ